MLTLNQHHIGLERLPQCKGSSNSDYRFVFFSADIQAHTHIYATASLAR